MDWKCIRRQLKLSQFHLRKNRTGYTVKTPSGNEYFISFYKANSRFLNADTLETLIDYGWHWDVHAVVITDSSKTRLEENIIRQHILHCQSKQGRSGDRSCPSPDPE
jgi:hypothetical protein